MKVGEYFKAFRGVYEFLGEDPKARKYKIKGRGVSLAVKDEICCFAEVDITPIEKEPFDAIAFIGGIPSLEKIEKGKKWALEQAALAEHPHLAEVWRRVAEWEVGQEVRVCLGAFGMADDVTRKWGIFMGFTPSGPKVFQVKMGDGRIKNLPIQAAIFNDLYEPGAMALQWETAYNW